MLELRHCSGILPYYRLSGNYVALQHEGVLMKTLIAAASAAFLILSLSAQAGVVGLASYYKSGKVTANGERYNPHGLTAAHRKLKFGTKVRITNLRNGKSVVVRINDRGPFIRGRVIDLSLGAAKVIGLTKTGVGKVSFTVLN
jgi:rare lipoprotein A